MITLTCDRCGAIIGKHTNDGSVIPRCRMHATIDYQGTVLRDGHNRSYHAATLCDQCSESLKVMLDKFLDYKPVSTVMG